MLLCNTTKFDGQLGFDTFYISNNNNGGNESICNLHFFSQQLQQEHPAGGSPCEQDL
jgi:hypothetical protein